MFLKKTILINIHSSVISWSCLLVKYPKYCFLILNSLQYGTKSTQECCPHRHLLVTPGNFCPFLNDLGCKAEGQYKLFYILLLVLLFQTNFTIYIKVYITLYCRQYYSIPPVQWGSTVSQELSHAISNWDNTGKCNRRFRIKLKD